MQKKLFVLILFQFSIIYEDCCAYPIRDVNIVSQKSRPTETSKKSFLWEIGTKPPSYLFGTIHVPYTTVWDEIPQNAKDAFHHAAKIYFELDFTDKKTKASIEACQYFPNENYLSPVLPSDLYHRVENHLEFVRRAMPYWIDLNVPFSVASFYANKMFFERTKNWEYKRPIWVWIMISSTLTKSDMAPLLEKYVKQETTYQGGQVTDWIEFAEETHQAVNGISSTQVEPAPFLDLYLSQKAQKEGKQVGGIEFLEEQCQALNGINSTLVEATLRQFLDEQEELRRSITKPDLNVFGELINDYREGNLDYLLINSAPTNMSSATEQEQLLNKFSKAFYENMLINRNEKMASRVIEQIKSNPETSLLFAFGAAHFLGENSVVELLRSHGLEVRRVPANVPFKVPFHLPISMINSGLQSKLDNRRTAILYLFSFVCIIVGYVLIYHL
jgi:uncharacterized protein YbaP (TraB family)